MTDKNQENQQMLVQSSFAGAASYFCVVCGRALKNPESVMRGIGPVCAARCGPATLNLPETSATDEFLFECPITDGLVLDRSDGGVVRTNVPHLAVWHSPAGFEFGYGGSGPADLALNLCESMLIRLGFEGDKEKVFKGKVFILASQIHQTVKRALIEPAPREGITIEYKTVVETVVAAVARSDRSALMKIRTHPDVVAVLGPVEDGDSQ